MLSDLVHSNRNRHRHKACFVRYDMQCEKVARNPFDMIWIATGPCTGTQHVLSGTEVQCKRVVRNPFDMIWAAK